MAFATYTACTSALLPTAGLVATTPSARGATTRLAAGRRRSASTATGPSAGGSYVLEAADGPEAAKGVVHTGGAFVGGLQLTYRYLLERFAQANYAVIATPFRLSFDYQSVCDAVEASYDAARNEAQERGYGSELEVVGVGHSCGALLQALIATRRPNERRRLALVSYNNKRAAEAIPLFESVVAPIAVEAVAESLPTTPFARQALSLLRNAGEELLDAATDTDSQNPFMRLRAAAPANVRALGDAFVGETSTIARQGLELADQLPDLLGEIAGGAREFEPEPREMRELLRLSFRADDVLVMVARCARRRPAPSTSSTSLELMRSARAALQRLTGLGRAAPGRGRGRGRDAGRAARAARRHARDAADAGHLPAGREGVGVRVGRGERVARHRGAAAVVPPRRRRDVGRARGVARAEVRCTTCR